MPWQLVNLVGEDLSRLCLPLSLLQRHLTCLDQGQGLQPQNYLPLAGPLLAELLQCDGWGVSSLWRCGCHGDSVRRSLPPWLGLVPSWKSGLTPLAFLPYEDLMSSTSGGHNEKMLASSLDTSNLQKYKKQMPVLYK